jgi:hypothetical protein
MFENTDICTAASVNEPSAEAWDEVLSWLNDLEENSGSLVLRYLSMSASLALGGISSYIAESRLQPDQGPFS